MILNLPNIAIHGINTDISPWDLPPEYITDGLNFRIGANAISTYGSYSLLASAPSTYYPAFGIFVRTQVGNFIVTTGTTIYSYQTSYNDITGTVSILAASVYLWSGCLNGSVVILNNSSDYPVYWNGSGNVTDLPWDASNSWRDKGYTAEVVRSHKNYLIALNVTDTISRPSSFRWSHPADTDGIPFTWDETDPSGTAGIQPLGGDGGAIIDGLSLRDSFIIYSQNAINVLDLSGDEFIWRVRELSSTVGLLSKDCVVEAKGVHYLMTHGDIVMCDGNTITSIAHDRIQNILRGINTDYVERAFAVNNEKNKEIWFCIPAGNDDEGNIHENVNLALIYQWKKDTWSLRELPEGSSFMFTAPQLNEANETWASDTEDWDEDITLWNDGVSATSFSEQPYAVNHTDSVINLLEPVTTEQDLNTFIERTNMAIGDQISVTTLTRIYPHIYGSNPIRIRVGSQDRAGGEIRWKDWKEFDPDVDRKIDVRTTGALHCYRIESIGTGKFRFAGLDVEYEEDGIR